jgi:acetolactate synthase-1/2/3 large subunit
LFQKTNYRTEHSVHSSQLDTFLRYVKEAYQPLLYIGGGIIRSNAFQSLQAFAKLFQIPVTTTLMGKSSYNEKDQLSLGMLGMHGTAYANFAVSECDLLIALGARFDDRVTGKLDEFACNAEVLHLDIDPAEISKNRCPQLAIIGDNRKILLQFFKQFREKEENEGSQTQSWLKRIQKWKLNYPLLATSYKKTKISPQETILWVGYQFEDAIFTTDVGQHQMWSAQFLNCQPKKWVSSSGLGTMGFGLPAAIGAKVANLSQNVICITGDSSFQMCLQELGTISQYQLGIKILILNNGWQGMVRQWQESFYGNRYSNSYMRNGMPNFAKLAKAYEIQGKQIGTAEQFQAFMDNYDSPNEAFVLDITVIENENCYPMVAPGRSNSQMLGLDSSIG